MSGTKYKIEKSGEWVQPIRKGYKLACCDCGLVHLMEFRLLKYGKRHKIQFRAYRAERSTAMMRRMNGIKVIR